MISFDQELKNVFLEEAERLLEEAESDVLALTQGAYNKENTQKLFRIAHTFKGSAKAAGFEFLSQLAHEFENVLEKIERDKLKFDQGVAAALLHAIDLFKNSIGGLRETFSYVPEELGSVVAELSGLGESKEPKIEGVTPSVVNPFKFGSPTQPDHPHFEPPAQQPPLRPSLSSSKNSSFPEPSEPAEAHASSIPKSQQDMIRISAEKLDRLVDLISELRVHRKQRIATRSELLESSEAEEYVDKIVAEAHDLSLTLRMTPLSPVFKKMQRVCWDASRSLGKDVTFESSGEDVELDKVIVQRVGEALTHLMRNAVDHGIEPLSERIKKGKPEAGKIKMTAEVQENRVLISISDDGAGLNRDRILKKGLEKGLVTPGRELTEAEVFALIFEPGFSTRDEITDLSGRGFGLDVVKQSLQDMGGTIEISSEPDQGTTFKLFLPLILAMIEGLVFEVDRLRYVVAMTQIQETVDLSQHEILLGQDQSKIFNLRGDVITLVRLGDLLHHEFKRPEKSDPKNRNQGLALVLSVGVKKVAFEVDRLISSQALTLRSLGSELSSVPGVKACAILNDGEPALVIHLAELLPVENVSERW